MKEEKINVELPEVLSSASQSMGSVVIWGPVVRVVVSLQASDLFLLCLIKSENFYLRSWTSQ